MNEEQKARIVELAKLGESFCKHAFRTATRKNCRDGWGDWRVNSYLQGASSASAEAFRIATQEARS